MAAARDGADQTVVLSPASPWVMVNPATGGRVGPVVHLPDTGRCPVDTRVQLVGSPDEPDAFLLGSNAPVYGDFFLAASSEQRVRMHGPAGRSVKQQIALASTAVQNGLWAGWRDTATDDIVIRRL